MKVLLCDDEPLLRTTLSDDLEDAGHTVELASDGDSAIELIKTRKFDCVVTDLAMPGADGMAVLAVAREHNMDAVMITGHGSVGVAVDAMRAGAFDFLEKPFLGDALVKVLERIADKRRTKSAEEKREEQNNHLGLDSVVGGTSSAFRTMLDAARRAAASDASLLLIGESGSGKEVLAKAIHEESARRKKPFVPVSCGAIASSLLDDELFGHEKGAFTDAKTARAGRFEEAEGGTLFLDDIDDMRLDTQVKLLRVLQEREFRRIGAEESRKIDVRIIAASKVDLDVHVATGHFRNDLLYRLQVLRLDIPPLRNRPEDIPELLAYFLAKHANGQEIPPMSVVDLAAVTAYEWPGNVRQLENSVCRALAMRTPGGPITAADLLPHGAVVEEQATDLTLQSVVRHAEKAHIERVLAMCGGNRSRTAEALGISRKNLWEKMRLLSIGGDEE